MFHTMRHFALTGLLFITLCLWSCQAKKLPAIDRVILFSIDTLRADFLGSYNRQMQTSPQIDRFASENILFSDVLAQSSNTAISHKSILYSVYPHVHKTTIDSIPEEKLQSPLKVLQQQGFLTAGFVAGGQLRPIFGFSRGFHSYQTVDLKNLEKKSFSWLDENHDKKFFLFLHTYQVHCPYNPPPHYRKSFAGWYNGQLNPLKTCTAELLGQKLTQEDYRFVRDLYAGNVKVVDDFFGRLVSKLQSLKIYDKTLFILLSDHGESLGEHNYVGHNQMRRVQLKIPLIVRLPGAGVARIDAPIESLDVLPTLFDILKVKAPFPFQGQSLLPLIRQEETITQNRVRMAQAWNEVYVHNGEYALRFWRNEPYLFLYDIKNDPAESKDLAPSNPEMAKRLRNLFEAQVSSDRGLSAKFTLTPKSKPKMDEESLENLKALGYVQD